MRHRKKRPRPILNPRGKKVTIRFAICEYQKHIYGDIRSYYVEEAGSDKWKPGKGVKVPDADPSRVVRDLIAAGESATVEFKSTARWDVKLNQPGKHIERIIVKTIAAFLNTDGGTLSSASRTMATSTALPRITGFAARTTATASSSG